MSDFTDEILFTLGLNSDDDPRVVPNTDYLYALNLISGTREIGAQVNTQGNRLVSYTLPAGRNKCIGALRDIKRNAVINYIWNENGAHSILHYFCETNVIEEILAPKAALPVTGIPFTTDFLGFTEFNKIHSSNILDDILTWTDGNVSPRKINIKRAKDFMLQLPPSVVNIPYDNLIATGSEEQKIQFIDSIKYAPVNKTDILLGRDATRNTNFIRNSMIQVIYRWIYDDNEKSRWSTGSYISLPDGQENILGTFASSVQNNYLAVTYNTGHSTVKAVDIAFRFTNLGTWARLDESIKLFNEDNERTTPFYSNQIFNFYNDRVLIPVDVADTDTNFDAVPLLAETQEIIDSNRLVYANNTEGYQNPEPKVSFFSGNTILPLNGGSTAIKLYATSFLPPFKEVLSFPNDIGDIAVGMYITFNIKQNIAGQPQYNIDADVNYTVSEYDLSNYPTSLRDGVFNYLIGLGPVFMNQLNDVQSLIPSAQPSSGIIFETFTHIFLLQSILPTTKVTSNKRGAYHKYGIVYYDKANRDGGVVTNADMQIYVKTLPEFFLLPATPPPLVTTNAYQSDIQISINHIPPDWAETYQIVYAKNNLRKYVQFILKGEPRPVTTGYELDCTYLFNYIENDKVVTSVNIQFEKGDRLRFISNAENYCGTYVEVEVVSMDVTNKKIIVRSFNPANIIGNMAIQTFEGATVEYFAYKSNIKPANEFYFEIGEIYSIVQPHTSKRRHSGNVSNQNAAHTIPATIKLTRGDTYVYRRYFHDVAAVVESQDFSDFYESSNFDYSRVQGVRNEKTKQHAQQLRYGGRYFADTLTNNLLSFGGNDYDTLQTNHGPINKIINIGYTLKCLQTKKVTSIYVNRQMIFNADGTQNVTLVNQVIGTKDPSNLDYGCANPESVCKDDRQIYFFDINNGAVIQDSANGMFPISGYKMATYFKNKAEEMRNTGGNDKIFVYADSDNYNETVNFIFSDENTIPTNFNSETILYGTRNNRWSSFQSYVGDYIVSNALTLISYKDGAMYVHNDSAAPRCNFYGVQYGSKIKFVVNNNPEMVKTFDWMGVNSNKIWTSPNDTDITTPANANYSTGMASRLLEGRFRPKEGVFYADYARDLNTPNVTNPIMNGQRLRGTYLIQQIENNDTVRVNLFSVLIHNTYSLISG
mgnify:CR=1 FL=1|tara:strand:+ start:5424 stop:8891 length:3468 start_codon:yes stop_codon:yes gene_type:complete